MAADRHGVAMNCSALQSIRAIVTIRILNHVLNNRNNHTVTDITEPTTARVLK